MSSRTAPLTSGPMLHGAEKRDDPKPPCAEKREAKGIDAEEIVQYHQKTPLKLAVVLDNLFAIKHGVFGMRVVNLGVKPGVVCLGGKRQPLASLPPHIFVRLKRGRGGEQVRRTHRLLLRGGHCCLTFSSPLQPHHNSRKRQSWQRLDGDPSEPVTGFPSELDDSVHQKIPPVRVKEGEERGGREGNTMPGSGPSEDAQRSASTAELITRLKAISKAPPRDLLMRRAHIAGEMMVNREGAEDGGAVVRVHRAGTSGKQGGSSKNGTAAIVVSGQRRDGAMVNGGWAEGKDAGNVSAEDEVVVMVGRSAQTGMDGGGEATFDSPGRGNGGGGGCEGLEHELDISPIKTAELSMTRATIDLVHNTPCHHQGSEIDGDSIVPATSAHPSRHLVAQGAVMPFLPSFLPVPPLPSPSRPLAFSPSSLLTPTFSSKRRPLCKAASTQLHT